MVDGVVSTPTESPESAIKPTGRPFPRLLPEGSSDGQVSVEALKVTTLDS